MSAGFSLDELAALPPRSWAAFYRAVESERLRHYARLVGVAHPKSPAKAQRDLLRAAARVAGGGLDLLRTDAKRLRRMVEGIPGVAVETAPAPDRMPEEPDS